MVKRPKRCRFRIDVASEAANPRQMSSIQALDSTEAVGQPPDAVDGRSRGAPSRRLHRGGRSRAPRMSPRPAAPGGQRLLVNRLAPMIMASAAPSADTNGTATAARAIVLGRNLSPSGPPMYAPIGNEYRPAAAASLAPPGRRLLGCRHVAGALTSAEAERHERDGHELPSVQRGLLGICHLRAPRGHGFRQILDELRHGSTVRVMSASGNAPTPPGLVPGCRGRLGGRRRPFASHHPHRPGRSGPHLVPTTPPDVLKRRAVPIAGPSAHLSSARVTLAGRSIGDARLPRPVKIPAGARQPQHHGRI